MQNAPGEGTERAGLQSVGGGGVSVRGEIKAVSDSGEIFKESSEKGVDQRQSNKIGR
jgi:hypothetical protein